MIAFIIFAFVLANFNIIDGAPDGDCYIKGLSDYDWYGGFTREETIGDTHEGLIVTYNMEKTLEMTSYESTYLDATFVDNKLSIFTNERFKKFEEEYEGSYWYTPSVDIKMKFTCANNNPATLNMEQEVTDDNTHDPIFNKDVYEFHFGMSVPADYELTKLIPMTASDKDFMNTYVYFTMDFSDDVIVQYEADDYYDLRYYTTNLKTLKELKAPYKKELNIFARDNGSPSRNSTARIIITVTSNGNENNDNTGSDEDTEDGAHPPVFAKHLYFANYTSSHELKMEETITIKYGAEDDTIIKQSGYDEYFKITLNPKIKGALEIRNLQSLPDTIMESTSFIVLEIEAENKNLHMPGRTALLVHLPYTNQENSTCSASTVLSYSDHSSISLIFFVTAIFMILIMNIVVLIWFFQKKKTVTEVVRVQYPVHPIDDITRMEKVRI